ncbi:MAG: 50S ribosomal protein L15 [Thermodesulfobacteriota bacterium]
MILSRLKPPEGSIKNKKRVGRGNGSGHGKTCGKGHKGYKSRAGGKVPRGYEGGQMPIQRRVPKRGFTNIFKTKYSIVKVGDLSLFKGSEVIDIQALRGRGLVRKKDSLVKILGDGMIGFPVTVRAHKFSISAQEKIETAGGKVEVI